MEMVKSGTGVVVVAHQSSTLIIIYGSQVRIQPDDQEIEGSSPTGLFLLLYLPPSVDCPLSGPVRTCTSTCDGKKSPKIDTCGVVLTGAKQVQ